MNKCPLCCYEFNETALSCATVCPIAAVQGCHIVCCPNCGYQMADERKLGITRWLRRTLTAKAKVAPNFEGALPK